MRTVLVLTQAFTFPGLAYVLYKAGEPQLAGAQLCLGVATILIYL